MIGGHAVMRLLLGVVGLLLLMLVVIVRVLCIWHPVGHAVVGTDHGRVRGGGKELRSMTGVIVVSGVSHGWLLFDGGG